jgi:hypothetical protein
MQGLGFVRWARCCNFAAAAMREGLDPPGLPRAMARKRQRRSPPDSARIGRRSPAARRAGAAWPQAVLFSQRRSCSALLGCSRWGTRQLAAAEVSADLRRRARRPVHLLALHVARGAAVTGALRLPLQALF